MRIENLNRRCSETTGMWRQYQCSKKAKYFENGKDYCGIHAPSRIKIREEKRAAKKEAEESTLDSIRWQIKDHKYKKKIAEEYLKFYRKKLAELYPGEPEELEKESVNEM